MVTMVWTFNPEAVTLYRIPADNSGYAGCTSCSMMSSSMMSKPVGHLVLVEPRENYDIARASRLSIYWTDGDDIKTDKDRRLDQYRGGE